MFSVDSTELVFNLTFEDANYDPALFECRERGSTLLKQEESKKRRLLKVSSVFH